MATITTRTAKGSPLTIGEVDANFTNLNTDKLQLETNGDFLISGKVGIGTTTPSVGLEVGSNTVGQVIKVNSTLGAELCPALSVANWTLLTGWGITSGILTKVAGTAANAYPTIQPTITVGTLYKVVMTVTAATIGNNYLSFTLGGNTGKRLDSGAVVTSYIKATTTAGLILLDVSVSEFITITSISIKAVDNATGSIAVENALTVNGTTTFANSVGFNTTSPNAPVEIMDTGSGLEGLRISRNGTPTQYMSFSQDNGGGPTMKFVGDKPVSFRSYATNNGYLFATNNNTLNAAYIHQLGRIGIQTTTPTYELSFSGLAPRTIWLERHTTTNNAGNTLTIQAGGATPAATNQAGGQLILKGGISTGTGTSGVTIQSFVAGTSGTADANMQDMITVLGSTLAFYGTSPTAKPIVSGSKSSGAALQSLLTALSTLGLITDSTTA